MSELRDGIAEVIYKVLEGADASSDSFAFREGLPLLSDDSKRSDDRYQFSLELADSIIALIAEAVEKMPNPYAETALTKGESQIVDAAYCFEECRAAVLRLLKEE